jgi:NAD(P)-dependent dehydrogenase (short-subunit alcohol dehydrogenase family)
VVRSPLWAAMTKTNREQLYRDIAAWIPAGRAGEADDIAHAYLSCLTEPFTTGSILTVDGGNRPDLTITGAPDPQPSADVGRDTRGLVASQVS